MRTPGLYDDVKNEDYHAETDWASSTQLKLLLPEQFKAGGSPEALAFGNLFHTVVLEPDRVASDYVALDAEKIGLKADGTPAQNPTATTAWKTAVSEAEKDGKIVVAQADMDRAYAMRDAILKHDTAPQLLFTGAGRSEVSAYAVDAQGNQHKARFDKLIPGAVVDLKSTSAKPGEDAIARAIIDYGYDLSAVHYLEVAQMLGLDVTTFAFVFVGKEPPYHVTVCDLDEAFLARGRALRDKAIARLLDPTEPSYQGATGFLTIYAPEWALRKVLP